MDGCVGGGCLPCELSCLDLLCDKVEIGVDVGVLGGIEFAFDRREVLDAGAVGLLGCRRGSGSVLLLGIDAHTA